MAVAERRPVTLSASPSRRWRRTLAAGWLCAGLAVAVPGAPWAQPMGLPSMGAASTAELSPALERTLGDAIMEQGRREPSYLADPEVSQYLTDLGRRLAVHGPGGDRFVSVFAVRDAAVNAFALPGGYVGINSGLVAVTQSESELASVIAHEIAHVSQRHIARGMTQDGQSAGMMTAALVASLLAALAGSGDLAMGIAAFGQAAAIDQRLRFSRQAEQESDRLGLDMMRKAGFDVRGMLGMFQRLMASNRLNEGMGAGAFHHGTHPQSVQRLADMENRVRGLPAVRHEDSATYWLMRARLRVIQARDGRSRQAVRHALESEARQAPDDVQRSAAWYGLAYSALQARQYDEAARLMDEAGRLHDGPELAVLRAQLALARKQVPAALAVVEPALKRWPDYQGLVYAQVDGLQAAGRDAQAADVLQQALGRWPDEARLYEQLARSQERLGRAVDARRTQAIFYEKTGALPAAVDQLQQARSLSKDFYVQSEIDARIRELRRRLDNERELLRRFRQ